MRFNPRARLDTGQVQSRRGGSTGLTVGGGVGGLLVLLLVFLVNQYVGGGAVLPAGPTTGGGVSTGGEELSRCRTGADAERDPDCARVAVVNSVQTYWEQALPQQAGQEYVHGDTVFFSERVSTGCGTATSTVGPFYCPTDRQVYLDTTFFHDMLQNRLGGRGGDFAEAYVIAHEYGHHVQNLLGTLGRVRTQEGAGSDAVRLELQADCYAGMWSGHATHARDAAGEVLIERLSREDVEEALDTARAVGDDRIQRRSSGRVDPESWTHGSAEQRMRWFSIGREQGSLHACDTFAAREP